IFFPTCLSSVLEAAGGDLRFDLVALLLGYRHHHVGADVARRYRVDGHAELRVFLRQRDREPVHAGFRRGVVRLPVLALLAVDRADLADPAPLARAHPFGPRTGAAEAGPEVGADAVVPPLGRQPVQGRVAGDAGVVDEDLDRAELLFDVADEPLGVLRRRHVTVRHRDVDAGVLHPRLPLAPTGFVAVIGRDAVAHRGQPLHDRGANA